MSHIKSFKLIHVRFFDSNTNKSTKRPDHVDLPRLHSSTVTSTKSLASSSTRLPAARPESMNIVKSSRYPASLSLASMMNLGKFIPPTQNAKIHCLLMEEFDLNDQKWTTPT
ncbi:hypothetical protein SNE40_006028 [Patella caerulea]|uniref:Uncharacterized protein n=1 Tax=Patella caerulea TaxID=87958 RepID=A0AAN8JW27_PATCE